MESDSFWFELTGLVVLLVFSAFFSGSETAFTAASRARLMTLENEGNKRAKLINKLSLQKDKVIGSLLFGNNLVNILASALATSALIKMFGEAGIAYATLGVTFLVLVFSEVLPKTYALTHAEKVSLAVAPVLAALVAVFSPVTYGVARIVQGVFHMCGVKTVTSYDEHEEELRGAIQIFKESLDMEEEQEKGSMLRSILDLADVEVEAIMTHRKNVQMINADAPVSDIVEQVMNSTYTRLPVWKGDPDNIVGVIHSKLLLKEILACKSNLKKVDLSKAMLEPWFIPESTTLFAQLQAFRQRREHFAIMVDEYGSLMGVVTLEDILEEIVGDIHDESDNVEDVSGIHPQADGSYLVNGDVTIRDVNRMLNWKLPDEEYSTVAGLVLFESQRIPEEGQAYHLFDCQFEVLKKDRNQITLIRIVPRAKEA